MLRAKITTGDPTPPDRFLGCYLRTFEAKGEQVAHALAVGHTTLRREEKGAQPYKLPERGQNVRGHAYDMEIYLRDCVDKYCATIGISKDRLMKVPTPFIDETKDPLCWVGEEIRQPIDWAQFKKDRRQ